MSTANRPSTNGWTRITWALTTLAALPLAACGGGDGETSAGGSAGSGGGGGGTGGGAVLDEEPNHDLAFPQDRVPRLDITITAEDWQTIVADMTDMLGEPGSGAGTGGPGGPGGEPPQELITACEGLTAGDACTATFMGSEIMGTCTAFNGDLACLPSGGPGGGGGGAGGGGGGIPGGGPGDGVDLLPRTPVYVECDVATEEREWHHVGVRLKGNSSLATPWQQGIWKLPLRLSFDRFEDTYPETNDQRFHGFKSLSLSNGAMDSSLLRDKLGTEVFVRAGIAAPATAFYRVFIDHGDGPTYFGLYTAVEVPSDSAFMDTRFGGHDGNLYKPDGTGARWETWDPDTLGKENHEDEADFSDAQALFDALHADRTDAESWRSALESRIDADGFLHWLALNTVVQDWDTYGRMPHNYYMYSNPAQGGRFTWIPWDHSFAFSSQSGALSLGMSEVSSAWPLIRYLLDDPHYVEVYRAHVAKAVEEEYDPAWAKERFQAAHDLIAPYVIGPEGEIEGHTFLASDASFEDSVGELSAHVEARKVDVAAFLLP